MKLMQSKVKTLDAPSTGQVIYWDDELSGFGLRVTPGSRSYVVQGRVNGKNRRFTISPERLMAVAQARDRAARMLLAMRDGIDPQEEKRRKKVEGLTLREVMQDYVTHKTTKHGPLRPRSKASIERHVTVNFAAWADRPVAEIDEAAVLKQFRVLKKQGSAQAYQATSVLQSLLKWARKTNKAILENPLDGLKGERQKPKKRTGRIPNDKVGAVFALLRARSVEVGVIPSTRTGADIVSFLILTGARWSEAAELTWDRVDLDAKVPCWRLNEDNSKNHNPVILPLSSAAVELLKGRRGSKNRFVFPARSGGGVVTDARPTMTALNAIAGERLTPHDMRRTFTNVAIKVGVDLFKAELLTNHVPQSVTLTHYFETSDLRESCAAEIERIGTWIVAQAETAKAVAAGKNVVRMRA